MNAQRRDQLRSAKIRTGVFIASYEAIALAVDNPELVPRLTDIGHRYRWVGRGMAAWSLFHLAIPGAWPLLLALVQRVRRA